MSQSTTISAEPSGDALGIKALGIGALAARARSGCLTSFTELVERFESRLFNFLLRRCGSITDAEDLAQETFVRAWRAIGQYNPRWQFSTWLFTIAHRLAVTEYRRRRRERAMQGHGDPATGHADDPASVVAHREESRLIWDLADRVLGQTQREALWLRYAEDLSIRAIARVLGKTPVTVRVTLFRAREALDAHQSGFARMGRSQPAGEREGRKRSELKKNLAGDLTC